MKRSNDNPLPNSQIRPPGYPTYAMNHPPQMTFQPHVFTPVQIPKTN